MQAKAPGAASDVFCTAIRAAVFARPRRLRPCRAIPRRARRAHAWPSGLTPSAGFPAVGKGGPIRCFC